MSAIDIQNRYLEAIRKHLVELPAWSEELLNLLGETLDALSVDPMSLCGKLEWPTKLALFEASDTRSQKELLVLDQFVSDLREPLLGEYYQKADSEIVSAQEIETAIANPPSGSRASIRGTVVKRLRGQENVFCGWSHIYTPTERLRIEDPFATKEIWHTI